MMLGAREAFFTELPRRGLLGNWAQSRSYRSGDIDSGGRVGLVVGVLGQALLVKLQLRFSIPNAHERTRASFSTAARSSVAAPRTKKSTGIRRLLPAMRFSRRRVL